jgi:putative transcriptional regulator
MREELFEELLESVREGGAILRGERRASRRFEYAEEDVRAIRERYALSQPKFAALMGISVATLRNWEQGRRQPEGSARVLLRVVARHPDAVLDVVGMRSTSAEQGTRADRGQRAVRAKPQRRVSGGGG